MKISKQFLSTLLLLTFAIFLLIGLAASGEQLGSFSQLYQQQQTQGGSLKGQQSPAPAMQPSSGQLSIGGFSTPKAPYTQQGALSLSLGGFQVKGKSTAPVTLVEYSDFTCYFCGRFYRETLPDLVKNYIDTGKIYFMYRDYPRGLSGTSLNTSMAARCAGEQGQYWPMHGKNYDGKRQWGATALKNVAKGLGVDTKKFDDCFDSQKYKKEITNDYNEGKKAGLRGVPHFVMFDTNKPNAPYTVIPGAYPYAKFAAEADKLLAKGGGKKPGPPSKPKKPSPPGKKTPSGKIGQDIKDGRDRTPQDPLKKTP